MDCVSAKPNGEYADAIFIKFTKVFDEVPHKHLFKKAIAYGISGPALHYVKDLHSGRIPLIEG